MRAALRATGWHDYSLFLRDDGLLVGYLETDDFAAAQAAMAAHRRQRALAGGDGRRSSSTSPAAGPDQGLPSLDEMFNLDAQLERALHMPEADDDCAG